jgi:hypothetical protein
MSYRAPPLRRRAQRSNPMILKDVYIKDVLIDDAKHDGDRAIISLSDVNKTTWRIRCTLEEYRAAIASINVKAVEK